MAQENVDVRLSYKFYSAGTMTANAKANTSTDPGASGAQELRRVASTLRPDKDTYQSNEVRTDRQVFDMRHGAEHPTGELSGELSPLTYFDFMEAAMRCTKVAAVSKSNTEFTSCAADTPTSKLTVGGSTWAAQGFFVGDVIRLTNMSNAANNNVNFLITALAGVDATVYPAPTTQTADTTFNVSRVGKKISPPLSSHVSRKVAVEHFHQTSDVAQLFTEGRVLGFGLSMPASGLATIRIPLFMRSMSVLTTVSAPYFSSPTAVTSTGLTAAVNGVVLYNGSAVGVITGIDINLSMAVDAPVVAGQNFVADILLGRTVVQGQFSALFTDETFLNAFNNETEFSLMGMLTTNTATPAPFVAFSMPRCKLLGADVPLQGEGALVINCPFQALLPASATGTLQSTLAIQDSEA